MKKYLLTGTFDPPTKGHVDLVLRTLKLCDRLIIAVMENSVKQTQYSATQRVRFWQLILTELAANTALNNLDITKRVEIIQHTGLVVDVVRDYTITAVVRGVRNAIDFEYEQQMAAVNKSLNQECETILLPARAEFAHVNSSIVRELIKRGADYSAYIPMAIDDIIKNNDILL